MTTTLLLFALLRPVSGQRCEDPATDCPADTGIVCTTYACDSNDECAIVNSSAGFSCDDGDKCNGNEACDGIRNGVCVSGIAVSCNDANQCTQDICDPMTGTCRNVPMTGESCSDNNACNGEELCDSNGVCQPGTPLDCNDNNACTEDSCDSTIGCINTPNGGLQDLAFDQGTSQLSLSKSDIVVDLSPLSSPPSSANPFITIQGGTNRCIRKGFMRNSYDCDFTYGSTSATQGVTMFASGQVKGMSVALNEPLEVGSITFYTVVNQVRSEQGIVFDASTDVEVVAKSIKFDTALVVNEGDIVTFELGPTPGSSDSVSPRRNDASVAALVSQELDSW